MNLLALDLHMFDTRDFSVVPGASAFNVAAIVQEGSGIDTEASYANRIGANFGRRVARSEGHTVAVRSLLAHPWPGLNCKAVTRRWPWRYRPPAAPR